MRVNTGKSHLLLSGNSRATSTFDNSDGRWASITSYNVGSNLTFENHINSICKKTNGKLK